MKNIKSEDGIVVLYGAGTQNLRMAFQPIVSAGFQVAVIVDKDKKSREVCFMAFLLPCRKNCGSMKRKRKNIKLL